MIGFELHQSSVQERVCVLEAVSFIHNENSPRHTTQERLKRKDIVTVSF